MIYRAVYWVCFPLLAVVFVILKYRLTDTQQTVSDAAYCISFLLVQLFILWIYFLIKHKKPVNIANGYLGWGDILFLLTAAFYLSPVNYVIYYILSLILVLTYVVLKTSLSKKTDKHIPLAGLQAAILALFLIIDYISPKLTLYADNWIYF
ncbi:hypothetical protein [Pedobacter metabolipauper]|nr:hypothetical protein [Pedobacter metabolipauper]